MKYADKKEIKIKAMWDTEAEVRIAVSDDVPGLVTEAETSKQLVRKLRILIPELLEANGLPRHIKTYPHHKHIDETVRESFEISLNEVLSYIRQ